MKVWCSAHPKPITLDRVGEFDEAGLVERLGHECICAKFVRAVYVLRRVRRRKDDDPQAPQPRLMANPFPSCELQPTTPLAIQAP